MIILHPTRYLKTEDQVLMVCLLIIVAILVALALGDDVTHRRRKRKRRNEDRSTNRYSCDDGGIDETDD